MRRGLRISVALLAGLLAAVVQVSPGSASKTQPQQTTVADTYYRALLLNTPFVESTWDAAAGSYRVQDFYVVSVFGNAVLLSHGTYDEQLAGVSKETLRDHTIRSIAYAAAKNRWVDPSGGTWGKTIYWDSTMETYFVAAAKMMWPDLTDTTRQQVDTIIRSAADNIVDLGANSPETNGLAGGYVGNTRMEEMGARTMPLAAALAWLPNDPRAGEWREWHARWMLNMGALPQADQANPTVIAGKPVSQWSTAHNIFDTFIIENHNSWNPMYQQSMGAYPGRNAVQFLLAGRQLPEEILRQPNDDALWDVMARLGTDAGVSQDFMIDDRHHLYGRALLPITYRATVARDRYAARAEAMLADRLLPYVQYAPEGRLTKFSGEPKYEPEARAEVAMSYLLHTWSDQLGGPVTPVSQEEYFKHFTGATDYGTGPGLVAHQTERALSGALSKPGFVKFAYLPQHDDWLFDVAGKSPALLPSVDTIVQARQAHVYTKARDGLDATATALRTTTGVAGFTTLPDGTVVYATSGTAAGEGTLRLYNLTMPGVPGLDGDRTYSWDGGSATLAAGLGDGGVDEVRFPATTARYVRMSGTKAANQYGFSLWELEAYNGASANLAQGKAATASSNSTGFEPAKATDGDAATRWAVSTPERPNPGWLAVDLGQAQQLDKVVLRWETAYATAYDVQVSDDGQTWRTVASVPRKESANGNWLNVDGRAGFVVRGSDNPITVTPTGVVLSDGPAAKAAGMVVEGYPAETPAGTAAHAATPNPGSETTGLAASLVGGHLSLFNLTASPIEHGTIAIPKQGKAIALYEGTQQVTAQGTRYDANLAAADARIAPARFEVTGPIPAGVTAAVSNSTAVRFTTPASATPVKVQVKSKTTGESKELTLAPGATRTLTFGGPVYPTSDLARDRTTFPTSPRPADMTPPANAVDGNPSTAWRPGSTGRMVADLGAAYDIGTVKLSWTSGKKPAARVEISTDGTTYTPLTGTPANARYVAVVVTGWQSGQAELTELSVVPPAER